MIQIAAGLLGTFPLLGPIRALDFGRREVDAYIRHRRQQRAADSAINRELELVRAAFKLAVDNEELSRVPKIRMLEEDNVRSGFLEHHQYVYLKEALFAYLFPLFVTGYNFRRQRATYAPSRSQPIEGS